MKARRGDTSERVPESEPSCSSVGDDAVLAAVDAALGGLQRREFLTRDEAIQTLLDVQARARDVVCAPRVASLVNDALVHGFDGQIIDKQRVADVLLDLRLALTPSSGDGVADFESAFLAR